MENNVYIYTMINETKTYRINLVESGNNVMFTGTYEDLKLELSAIVAKSTVPCKLREIGNLDHNTDGYRYMVVLSEDFQYMVSTEEIK